MSAILDKLSEDIKSAMKGGDAVRLSVLRLIKSTAKNKEIELQCELTDGDFIAALSTMVKQRQESVDQYRKVGQEDRAAAEQAEIDILRGFLPQALSSAELTALIREAVAAVGATGAKDMGLVMKQLKDKTAGRVDGKVLADQVREVLK